MKRGKNSIITTKFAFTLWYGDFDYHIELKCRPETLTLGEILCELWTIPEEEFQLEFSFKNCVFEIYEPEIHDWELLGSLEHRIESNDLLRFSLKK